MLKDKRILITGAAGFIGFHLCRSLLEKGFAVTGLDNINDYYDVGLKYSRLEILEQYENFTFVKGNIADEQTVNELFESLRPQIVVNLAAQAGVRYSIVNPKVYIESNIIGFINLLEACRNHPVEHFVYASSSSVYGNSKKTPFSVTDDVSRPISLYAATKKSDELMAFTYSHLFSIPSTGLRFFTVYGPYGRPDMAYFKFTEKIFAGETIKLFNFGDTYRDYTYIDDIVKGIENIMPSPPEPDEEGERYKVYNIGNNKPEKLETFVETLEKAIGREAVKEYVPMQPGDVYQTYADVSELMRDFDFRPDTPIETGIGRFIEWYREYYGAK